MFNKDRLVQILEEKKWSAYRLSKISGVAQATISEIISEKIKSPNTNTIMKLAIALGVPVDYFFIDIDSSIPAEQSNEHRVQDPYLQKIENAMKRMSEKDKQKMIDLLKLTFEEAFQE